jgi:hypothetical protein
MLSNEHDCSPEEVKFINPIHVESDEKVIKIIIGRNLAIKALRKYELNNEILD